MGFLCFLPVTLKLLFHILATPSHGSDTIRPPQFLREGQTLVSGGGTFELGFFKPGASHNLYLGIWYKTIPLRTVVWVANRDSPIQGTQGILQIITAPATSVQILSGDRTLIWYFNSSARSRNPILQLLDSGNFVLRDESDGGLEMLLWQSFDYPSDTLLPGMKLGTDLRTGFRRRLTSWKAPDDPSPGELTYGIELHGYPESVMWRNSREFYRTGPWNGLRYSGAPELRPNPLYHFEFNITEDEVSYSYQLNSKSVISMLVINGTSYSGQRHIWVEGEQAWQLYLSFPRDLCDQYRLCGSYGICDIGGSPVCQCLSGFRPKLPEKWGSLDWGDGCARMEPLNCSDRNGFRVFDGLKLPDTTKSWVNASMGLEDCRKKCLANCSCSAYANSDVRGSGSGCAIWFGHLTDMRRLPIKAQRMFVRMPASEQQGGTNHLSKKAVGVIVASVITMIIGLIILFYCIHKRRTTLRDAMDKHMNENHNEEEEDDMELALLDFTAIEMATDNFAEHKKLGEGGFGSVYKGILQDGQVVAVKRLSVASRQGLREFKNEATLIAKLQHRNLVKLLGYCIRGGDQMLIYEYMPNKSLDFFIFNPTMAKMLDWSKRFHIICGIARGILYLHQDSRLRIIHRDLKANNILLDDDMNPKISDFGLARSFGNDIEAMEITKKVVGTYGYMAPEYVVDGFFSVKSDVYSFGVLLLEIVSGKRNRGFHHQGHGLSLTGHAWTFWKEGRAMELIDPMCEYDMNFESEICRMIHVGLLCVQQHPDERPNMSLVMLMLSSEGNFAEAKHPGFFINKSSLDDGEGCSSTQNKLCSHNDISMSIVEPR